MLEVMFDLQPDRKSSAMEQNDVSGHTPLHKAVLFNKTRAAIYLLEQVGVTLLKDIDQCWSMQYFLIT